VVRKTKRDCDKGSRADRGKAKGTRILNKKNREGAFVYRTREGAGGRA